ncbi:putative CopG family transcriptional regulator [Paenibacillus agaridevorans]|uniref:Putative CopG family transcriptional regulator n=1 Tax=Paenibacillus agaridevorans TaxID=171404 RepID=A0A2R5EWB9_9BACL|nr:hypothetical protein [Paenibacillus agaridevorans]GBG08083.1 putative CopG family transcriptional regulator [Paenibacillus agaridevorans]
MPKKMGRPTEKPKTSNLLVRVDDETLSQLEVSLAILKAEQPKMKQAEVVRLAIRHLYEKLTNGIGTKN